jgi:PAS domain S-box-containing protein
LILTNLDGTILYASLEILANWGWKKTALEGQNIISLISPESHSLYQQLKQEATHNQHPSTGLIIFLNEQELIQATLTLKPVYSPPGKELPLLIHELTLSPGTPIKQHPHDGWPDIEELVNNLSVGIYRNTGGPQGTFLMVNQAMVKLFEAESAQELLAHSVSDLYQDPQARIRFVNKINRQGFVKNEELNLVTLKGRNFTASITAVRVVKNSDCFYYDGIVEDITERKALETLLHKTKQNLERQIAKRTQELRHANRQLKIELSNKEEAVRQIEISERRYRQAIIQANAVPYQKDYKSSHYLYMGESILDLTGYTLEEIHAKGWKDIILEEIYLGDLTGLSKEEAKKQVMAGNIKHWRADIRIRQKNGNIRWLSDSAVQIFDSSGKPTGSLGILQDITERKLTEAALRLSEAQYRAVVEDQSELICRYQPDGIFTFVNDAFCRYFNKKREDLIGQAIRDNSSPELKEAIRHIISTLSKENPVRIIEIQSRHPEYGLCWHQWTTRMILDKKGLVTEYQSVGRDITNLKKAEIALKESENRFRKLAETAAVAICIVQDHKFKYVNPNFIQLTEFTFDELMGMDFWSLIHPEHRELVKDRGLRREMGEWILPRYEFKILTRTQKTKWIDFSAGIIELEGKNGIIGSALDITERKKTEEVLQNLSQALKQSPSSVMITDTQGIIEFVNPKFTQVTGYQAVEVIGKKPNILKSGEMPLPFYKNMWETITSGREWHGELHNRKKNGELFWEYASISPVRDNKGEIRHYIAVKEDITERKRMEQALRVSEEKNRALLNAIPDMIFLLSKEGIILDYKAENVFDLYLSPPRFMGCSIAEIMPPEVAQQTIHHIQKAFKTKRVQVYEYQLLVNQVLQDYEARLVVCSENEIVSIIRNITERKKIDRMKNEFISMVSHELRTPLTSIMGTLGLLVGGVTAKLEGPSKELVEVAYRNSERLENLINDILDIEKIESGKMLFHMKPVQLNSLLKQAIETNKPLENKYHIQFEFASTVDKDWIYADPERLTQVITNLLSNAAKFSFPESTVHITLEERDYYYRISVIDHGSGIPKDFRKHIFEKFAQADSSDSRKQGGTGLGLSICKSIIDKMGGKIGFKTRLDQGTVFFIDLPKWDERCKRDDFITFGI